MKVTTLGVIMALKNLGAWLSSYVIADIKADYQSFIFALFIYILINVPTDLFLLNHIQEKAKEEAQNEVSQG